MNIYTIYIATNIINNKCYIGFDSNWPSRKKAHTLNANNIKNNRKTYFYNAIKKHGLANFKWDILYQSRDRDHCLNIMEPHFILEHKSFGCGYNLTKGGDGVIGQWELKTPEEKNTIKMKRFNTCKSRSLEEKNAIKMKRFDTYNNKSIEEKDAIKMKRNHTNNNKSLEEKNAIKMKRFDTYNNKSIEEKNITNKKKSESHENRSIEEKMAIRKKQSNTYLNKSIEEKNVTNNKLIKKIICDIITKKEYNMTWAVRIGLI